MRNIRRKLRRGDNVALFVTILIVSLAQADELHQTHLCEIWLWKNVASDTRCSARMTFLMLATVRFIIIPQLNFSFCFMLALTGQDAMSICLNGVGFLFMLELDDVVFKQVIHRSLREKVQEVKLEVDDKQWSRLGRGWTVHTIVIFVVLVRIVTTYHTYKALQEFTQSLVIMAIQLMNLMIVGTRSRCSACCEFIVGYLVYQTIHPLYTYVNYPIYFQELLAEGR